jgi:hypothetical protein
MVREQSPEARAKQRLHLLASRPRTGCVTDIRNCRDGRAVLPMGRLGIGRAVLPMGRLGIDGLRLRPVTRSARRQRQLCRRRPWGLGSELRRHPAETGIIVYGWFMRWRLGGYSEWSTAGATVDGEHRGVVQQLGPRLLWISVQPGRHSLDLDVGTSRRAFQADLDLAEGEVVLIAFKPPTWIPFRAPGDATWCAPRTVVEPS